MSKLGPWENITYSAPNFTFYANGTVSGSSSIITLNNNQLINGTFSVSGNTVTIKFKKDSSATFDCNLTFDKLTKSFTGSYSLSILQGFAAGNGIQGEMKLESLKPAIILKQVSGFPG